MAVCLVVHLDSNGDGGISNRQRGRRRHRLVRPHGQRRLWRRQGQLHTQVSSAFELDLDLTLLKKRQHPEATFWNVGFTKNVFPFRHNSE